MIVYLSEVIHPDAELKLKKFATVVNSFDDIEKIDAIILRNININRELMEKAKNLKVIAKHGVGLNTIDLEAAKELGIKVIYTPTANINSVAELIVGLAISLYRKIPYGDKNLRLGKYNTIAPVDLIGREIKGKTVGLIGLGNIAKIVAKSMMKGFNTKVVAYDPYLSDEQMDELGCKKYNDIKELVRVSDIVNISVPLTKDTKNLISGDVFNCFKKGAILINAARGGVIDENDLYNALYDGRLSGAACDVFVDEPPRRDSNKLLTLDNFIALPHIGGNTEESLYNAGNEVVDEVLSILEGNEPKFPAYR